MQSNIVFAVIFMFKEYIVLQIQFYNLSNKKLYNYFDRK